LPGGLTSIHESVLDVHRERFLLLRVRTTRGRAEAHLSDAGFTNFERMAHAIDGKEARLDAMGSAIVHVGNMKTQFRLPFK
jgi:hypothetical protein